MRTISDRTMETPSLKYDKSKEKLSVEGRMIVCKDQDFWKKMNKEIIENNNIKSIEFDIEYINTDSIRNLLIILSNNKTTDFQIDWFYDDYDDDMKELGENIAQITRKKLNLIEK